MGKLLGYLSIYLSVYLSICLSICLSFCLCKYEYIYIPTTQSLYSHYTYIDGARNSCKRAILGDSGRLWGYNRISRDDLMSFIGDINFCQLTSLARPNRTRGN